MSYYIGDPKEDLNLKNYPFTIKSVLSAMPGLRFLLRQELCPARGLEQQKQVEGPLNPVNHEKTLTL